jgi:hypothetical protein
MLVACIVFVCVRVLVSFCLFARAYGSIGLSAAHVRRAVNQYLGRIVFVFRVEE